MFLVVIFFFIFFPKFVFHPRQEDCPDLSQNPHVNNPVLRTHVPEVNGLCRKPEHPVSLFRKKDQNEIL